VNESADTYFLRLSLREDLEVRLPARTSVAVQNPPDSDDPMLLFRATCEFVAWVSIGRKGQNGHHVVYPNGTVAHADGILAGLPARAESRMS
jgi:hypothetical protein